LDEQLEKHRIAELVEHLLPEDIVPFANMNFWKENWHCVPALTCALMCSLEFPQDEHFVPVFVNSQSWQ
jgi:hypothetical protein